MTLPLLTPRLTVREFTWADLDAAAAVFADPGVLWWEPASYTYEQTRDWLGETLRRYGDDGCAEYAVVLTETGHFIGDCGPVYREIEGRGGRANSDSPIGDTAPRQQTEEEHQQCHDAHDATTRRPSRPG